MATTVVNLRYEKYDVYIGRGSKWGNKYIIGKDGNREEVVDKYEEDIRQNKYLLSLLYELKNKRLGCFCKPLSCHGDVLVKLIGEFCD